MPAWFIAFILLIVPSFLGAASSTITLTSSANPVVLGHAVTLTAVVSPAAATGTVTYYDGTTVLETEPLAGGKARFTTTLLAFGTVSLQAYYSGDAAYAPSRSQSIPQTVRTVLARGFAPGVDYLTGIGPQAAAVGDFNGDGKPDLVVANEDGSNGGAPTISVQLGNGDGTFQAGKNYNTADFPTGVAVGDFNGDGKPDLVVSNLDGYTEILIGNGDGTFQPEVSYISGPADLSVSVEDFNGDGKADLLFASNPLTVLLGNGDGTFQQPLTVAIDCYQIAVGDFNRDGKPDVAVTTMGSVLFILLGNGDGTFQAPASVTTPHELYGVAVGDFNGDGKADLAVTTPDNYGVSVLLGNGDGTFQPGIDYSNGQFPGWIAVGDFNGDGKADLFATGNELFVMLGLGDGGFQTGIDNGPFAGAAVLADFNGDGRTDLAGLLYASNGSDGVRVLLGIVAGPTKTTVVPSANPSHFGQNVTFTATVSPYTATGTMSFYHGSSEMGTASLREGQATFTTSTLTTGAHQITATYNGDAQDQASTSVAFPEFVLTGPTSTTLFSAPNPSALGQNVTLSAKVTPASATGTVTFSHGSSVLGTAVLVDGTATVKIATLSMGAHSLTAAYGGSGTYAPSVSPIVTQVVK